MLVLKVKKGESIIIADNVQVTFLDTAGSMAIRLGVNADPSIPVVREEIYEQYAGKPFVPYSKPKETNP